MWDEITIPKLQTAQPLQLWKRICNFTSHLIGRHVITYPSFIQAHRVLQQKLPLKRDTIQSDSTVDKRMFVIKMDYILEYVYFRITHGLSAQGYQLNLMRKTLGSRCVVLVVFTHIHQGYHTGHGHDDVIKWKHFPHYWSFVPGIHRGLPRYWPTVRGGLMFSLICVWINGWVKNRATGDLRRYRAHYDVTVMNDPYDCPVPFV